GAGCLVVSPDGQTLVCSGNTDNSLCLVDAATGRQRWLHKGGGNTLVVTASFSPDGKLLATGGGDQPVRLWDVASGKERHTLPGHDGRILRLAIAGNGQTVATGGFDGTVRLWDPATGKERGQVGQGWGEVKYLALSPDGKRLAGGGSWFAGSL